MNSKWSSMKNILFILSIFLCAEGFSQEAFAFFTQNGKRTSYRKLLRKSKKADIVLFGEYHNNPIAHWLEVKLTKDLLGKRSLILGAEMFERDNQDALDGYLEGTIDQKGLDSLARLWKNYKTDYKPWVDLAKREKLPIVATNIPRKYANLVYKKGLQALDTLPSAERKWIVSLPFPYDGNLSQYEKMKKMARHNPENLPMAQAIKDATMAESIETHYKKGSLFLHLNGSYHSDFFQGIYWYLRRRNPNLKILTISTLSQSNLKKLPSEAYGQADFILVVDEDMTAHTQLGDDNLLIYAGMTGGVLEVDADHLVLVSSKQLLNDVDVVVHHGWVNGVHHREIRLPRVGLHSMLAELHWSAAGHPLSMCRHGCACCVVGRDQKVEETKVIMATGIKGEAGRPGISACPDGSSNLQRVTPSCRT